MAYKSFEELQEEIRRKKNGEEEEEKSSSYATPDIESIRSNKQELQSIQKSRREAEKKQAAEAAESYKRYQAQRKASALGNTPDKKTLEQKNNKQDTVKAPGFNRSWGPADKQERISGTVEGAAQIAKEREERMTPGFNRSWGPSDKQQNIDAAYSGTRAGQFMDSGIRDAATFKETDRVVTPARPEEGYNAGNVRQYKTRAVYLATKEDLTAEEKKELREIKKAYSDYIGPVNLGMNGKAFNDYEEQAAWNEIDARITNRLNPGAAFTAGFYNGTGVNSMLNVGAAVSKDDDWNYAANQMANENYFGQLDRPVAYGAGNVAGSLAEMSAIGMVTGGAAAPMAKALAGKGIAAASANMIAQTATTALTFAASNAINNAGSVANGSISGAQYGVGVAASAIGGAAGSIASGLVSSGLAAVLRDKQLMTPFMEFVRQTASSMAFSTVNFAANEIGAAATGKELTTQEIAQELVTAFAFSAIHGAVNSYRMTTAMKEALNYSVQQMEEDYKRMSAGAYSEDEMKAAAERMLQYSSDIRDTISQNYYAGSQKEINAILAELDAIDAAVSLRVTNVEAPGNLLNGATYTGSNVAQLPAGTTPGTGNALQISNTEKPDISTGANSSALPAIEAQAITQQLTEALSVTGTSDMQDDYFAALENAEPPMMQEPEMDRAAELSEIAAVTEANDRREETTQPVKEQNQLVEYKQRDDAPAKIMQVKTDDNGNITDIVVQAGNSRKSYMDVGEGTPQQRLVGLMQTDGTVKDPSTLSLFLMEYNKYLNKGGRMEPASFLAEVTAVYAEGIANEFSKDTILQAYSGDSAMKDAAEIVLTRGKYVASAINTAGELGEAGAAALEHYSYIRPADFANFYEKGLEGVTLKETVNILGYNMKQDGAEMEAAWAAGRKDSLNETGTQSIGNSSIGKTGVGTAVEGTAVSQSAAGTEIGEPGQAAGAGRAVSEAVGKGRALTLSEFGASDYDTGREYTVYREFKDENGANIVILNEPIMVKSADGERQVASFNNGNDIVLYKNDPHLDQNRRHEQNHVKLQKFEAEEIHQLFGMMTSGMEKETVRKELAALADDYIGLGQSDTDLAYIEEEWLCYQAAGQELKQKDSSTVLDRLINEWEEKHGHETRAGPKFAVEMDMTDEQRYEELKKASVVAAIDKTDENNKFIKELQGINQKAKSKAEKIIKKFVDRLSVINKELNSKAIEGIAFTLSKGNGLSESMSNQLKYGGTYENLARVLWNLQKVLDGMVLVKASSVDRYRNTYKERKTFEASYVFIGALERGENIIPVKLEIIKNENNPGSLYVVVSLAQIKMTSVLGRVHEDDMNQLVANPDTDHEYSLTKIVKNINTIDKRFLKDIPNEMLSDKQIEAKNEALKDDQKKLQKIIDETKNRGTHFSIDIQAGSEERYMELAEKYDSIDRTEDRYSAENKIRRILDEKAFENGFLKKLFYHGSNRFGYTTYSMTENTDSKGMIYVTDKREVAANYGGRENYASVRNIGKPLMKGESTKAIIHNAKQVMDINYHVLETEERNKITKRIIDKAHEASNKIDGFYDAIQYLPNFQSDGYSDYYESPAHFYDMVCNLIWTATSDYDIKENGTFDKDAVNDIEKACEQFEKYYPKFKSYLSDVYDEIKGTKANDIYEYFKGHELFDVAIDIGYTLRKAVDDEQRILSDGKDHLRTAEEVKNATENDKNVGAYQLYVKPGDNVLEVDAGGNDWLSIKADFIDGKYHSTDAIAKWAKGNGYTAVYVKNVIDGGEHANEYILFDNNSLKSADPVTYDDSGNIIPLSERFNTKSNDIRFSQDVQPISDSKYAEQSMDDIRNELKKLMSIQRDKMRDMLRSNDSRLPNAEDWTTMLVRLNKEGNFANAFEKKDGVKYTDDVIIEWLTDFVYGNSLELQRNMGASRPRYGDVINDLVGVRGYAREYKGTSKAMLSYRKEIEEETQRAYNDLKNKPKKEKTVTIKDKEQQKVKPVSSAEYSQNREKYNQEEETDIEREAKRREAEVAAWQERKETENRMRAAHGETVITPAQIRGQSRDLKKMLGAKGMPAQEIESRLQEIAGTKKSEPARTYEARKEMADRLAGDMLQSVVEEVRSGDYETYKDIRKTLRGERVTLSAEDKAELKHEGGTSVVRQRAWAIGITMAAENGASPEVIYERLHDKYPHYFPKEINGPADSLIDIINTVEALKEVYTNPFQGRMKETTKALSTEIMAGIVADETPVWQKDDMVPAALAEEHQKQMESWYKDRIDSICAQWQEDLARVTAKQKADAAEKRTAKEEADTRTKLLNIVQRMKRAHLAPDRKAEVMDLISDIDEVAKSMTGSTIIGKFVGNTSTDTLETTVDGMGNKRVDIDVLQKWVEEQQANNPDFIPDKKTMDKIARLGRVHIADMDIADVRNLLNALQNIEHELKTANKLLQVNEKRDVQTLAAISRRNIEGTDGVKTNGIGRGLNKYVINEGLSPIRFFRRITGYHDDDPMLQRAIELQEGETAMINYQIEAEELFRRFTKDKAFMQSLSGAKAKEITFNARTNDGFKKLRITPDMRISLALHARNNDNVRHIERGGIVIPDFDLLKKGKVEDAYNQGTIAYMTKSQLQAIAQQMTEKERQYMHALDYYFSNYSSKRINETSVAALGYEIANVHQYFPIKVSRKYTNAELQTVAYNGSVDKQGFTNTRTGAANTIELWNATEVLTGAIRSHSKYVGMTIPVKNMAKLYGAKSWSIELDNDDTRDIQSVVSAMADTIGKKWQTEATDYIEKLMGDIQLPAATNRGPGDKLLGKVKSNYVAATLNLNLSVAMKQAASYPNGAAIVGWKALAAGLKVWEKVDMNLVAKYTPLLAYRAKGYSSQELGDIAKNNKQLPAALNWIQGMDVATTKRLWAAADYYVRNQKDHPKVETDDYWKAVAKVYNRIILETQPNYNAMERPQLLREQGSVTGEIFGMFKTQPLQNFNMAYDAINNMKAKEDAMKAAKAAAENQNASQADKDRVKKANEEYAEAKKETSQTVSALLVSTAVFSGMTLAWNMLRGNKKRYSDDDGEMTAWSTGKRVLTDMASSLAGMAPYFGTLYDMAYAAISQDSYYAPSSFSSDMIADTLSDLVNMEQAITSGKLFNGKTYLGDFGLQVTQTAEQIAKLFGIPAENVANTMKAIVKQATNTLMPDYEADYWYRRFFTKTSATGRTKEDCTSIMQAFTAGNDKAGNAMYKDLLSWASENAVQNNMYTGIQKAMKSGEVTPEIAAELLVKLAGKEASEASDAVAKWKFDNLGYKDTSASKANKYFDIAEPAGISDKDYDLFYEFQKDAKDVKDADGKTTMSKQQQIYNFIDMMNLTPAQKDALLSISYTTESAKENAPWNK